MTQDNEDPLAPARLAGRLEGQRFDARLRRRERREREDRLTRRIWAQGPDDEDAAAALPDGATQGEVWRLQQRVDELASFHTAVLRSRAWRLVQAVRRPFGRAW